MRHLLSKQLDHREIMEHVDRRIEAKVLKDDIGGLDVPYQISRIGAGIEELRRDLNTKLTTAAKDELRARIKHK